MKHTSLFVALEIALNFLYDSMAGIFMINKMKELRKQNHMTQKDLAKAVGVSQRTIISLEKGQFNPSLMLAYRISKQFHAGMEEVFCLEENLQVKSFTENLKDNIIVKTENWKEKIPDSITRRKKKEQ